MQELPLNLRQRTFLQTNTLYTATIGTGAKDPTGAALAANFVSTFTTVVAPTVVSTIPVNGATAAALNAAISATFSKAMDPATINATTFTVNGPGAIPVGGAVSYSGSTATFTPSAVLATGTLYTATITTGAKDPTGCCAGSQFCVDLYDRRSLPQSFPQSRPMELQRWP